MAGMEHDTDQYASSRLYLLRVQTEQAGSRVTLLEGQDKVRRGFASLADAIAYITTREQTNNSKRRVPDS